MVDAAALLLSLRKGGCLYSPLPVVRVGMLFRDGSTVKGISLREIKEELHYAALRSG